MVECPGCGATYELSRVQKTAAEFCAGCDYPLFWATRRAPIDEAETNASEGLAPTLRRRPGAAGLPIDSSDATAAWLASPVTTARWLIAHLIEPLAWLLLALVLLATARLGAERGRRLIRVGALASAARAAASALVGYSHGEAFWSMTEWGLDQTAMEQLYSRYQQAASPGRPARCPVPARDAAPGRRPVPVPGRAPLGTSLPAPFLEPAGHPGGPCHRPGRRRREIAPGGRGRAATMDRCRGAPSSAGARPAWLPC